MAVQTEQINALPFGKYRDVAIDTVPSTYLVWLSASKLSAAIRATVADELTRRGLEARAAVVPSAKTCDRCGPRARVNYSHELDRISRPRIRATCASCRAFIWFAPVCEPFTSYADASARLEAAR